MLLPSSSLTCAKPAHPAPGRSSPDSSSSSRVVGFRCDPHLPVRLARHYQRRLKWPSWIGMPPQWLPGLHGQAKPLSLLQSGLPRKAEGWQSRSSTFWNIATKGLCTHKPWSQNPLVFLAQQRHSQRSSGPVLATAARGTSANAAAAFRCPAATCAPVTGVLECPSTTEKSGGVGHAPPPSGRRTIPGTASDEDMISFLRSAAKPLLGGRVLMLKPFCTAEGS